MPDLFTLDELAAYMQVPAVNDGTGTLLRDLATGLIRDVYGSDLPDPAPDRLRRVALEATKRAYSNPNGYVSETLGDYSYNRGGSGSGGAGVYLTEAERQTVRAAAGLSTVRTVRLVGPYGDEDTDVDGDPFAVNPAWWT